MKITHTNAKPQCESLLSQNKFADLSSYEQSECANLVAQQQAEENERLRQALEELLSSDLPQDKSAATSIAVELPDLAFEAYRYKIGEADKTNCSDASGYSQSYLKSVKSTEEIKNLRDGDIKICILVTSGSEWMPLEQAIEKVWTKDTGPITVAKAKMDSVSPGKPLTIKGEGFVNDMTASIGGKKVDIKTISETEAQVFIPQDTPQGSHKLLVKKADHEQEIMLDIKGGSSAVEVSGSTDVQTVTAAATTTATTTTTAQTVETSSEDTAPAAPQAESPPPSPSSPSITVDSDSQVTLSWVSGGGTTADYKISYKLGATPPVDCSSDTQVAASSISGTSHVMTGLTHEQQYSFLICAINANSTPDISSGVTVTGTTLSQAAPPAPVSPSASIGSTFIALSWVSGGGSTADYRISYQAGAIAPVNCSTGTQISEASITGEAHSVTGLTTNTQYSFIICAINANATPDVSSGVTITQTTGIDDLIAIESGDKHTCALKVNGAAFCWGQNNNGQVGNSSSGSNQLTPQAVSGGHTFTQLAAGVDFSCGLRQDGSAYCWGKNDNGQVGNSTSGSDEDTPQAVSGSHVFSSLVTGGEHACGLKADGSVLCWGANSNGQLGDSSITDRSVPTAVGGGHVFTEISAGDYHSCGLKSDGTTYCWGNNSSGQLGDNTSGTDRLTPVAVTGSHTFIEITAGRYHSCGLKADGSSFCWGNNDDGQIGDGSSGANRHAPTAVTGSHAFTSIDAGRMHSCGRKQDGSVLCWGNNDNGQIGNNASGADILQPTALDGSHTMQEISVGGYHSCSLKANAVAMCWGANAAGQLGDSTSGTDRLAPIGVATAGAAATDKIASIAASHHTSCSLKADGSAYCWGYSGYDGHMGAASEVPAASVAGGHVYSQLSSGYDSTCGLRTDGSAVCWGTNGKGQVGDGAIGGTKHEPVVVLGGHVFTALASGQDWHCGLKADGSAFCWGNNASGQLGNGASGSDESSPVAVLGGHVFKSLTAGYEHTCGLTVSGDAYCWGGNSSKQIGDNTSTSRNSPTAVQGSHTFSSLVAGGLNTCALKADGSVFCWGANSWGNFGNGSNGSSQGLPTSAASGQIFEQLTIGYLFVCGLKAGGVPYCWGDNTHGQLGENSTTDRYAPYLVNGSHNFTTINAQRFSVCATKVDGSAYCWGDNDYGRVGDNTSGTDRRVPTAVIQTSL